MSATSDIVLSVDGVYKKFARSEEGSRRILAKQLADAVLNRTAPPKSEKGEFWALQDISFEVRRGEVLGVIGFNGAGKSTLLRVLSGLMLPDAGEVRAYGTTGALIELGAGMKPSLTGRRNIFIKGALLGKTPDEMEELYPQIAEFSELGDFLNSPVKTYSSGMRLRLGFSVAVHMRPDILLLDEILSVGDYAFKQKCRGRINEMLESAGVVFVTHSMNDVRQICDRVIVLDRGSVLFHGAPQKAIDLYLDLANKGASGPRRLDEPTLNFYGELFHNSERIEVAKHGWCDENGAPKKQFDTWLPAQFRTRFKLTKQPRRLEVGVSIWSKDGARVASIATDMSDEDIFDYSALEHEIVLQLPQMSLNPGAYVSTVAIVDNGEALFRGLNHDFVVHNKKRNNGCFTPVHTWRSAPVADAPEQEESGDGAGRLSEKTIG